MRDPVRVIVMLLGSTLFGGALATAVNLIVHPGTQNGGPAGAGLLAGFGLGLLLVARIGDW